MNKKYLMKRVTSGLRKIQIDYGWVKMLIHASKYFIFQFNIKSENPLI